jgi:hypothetical protein
MGIVTVRELKHLMHNLPDDMEILIHVRGDHYSPLKIVNPNAVYHNGDAWDVTSPASDTFLSEEKWEAIKSMPRTLILYWEE